VAFQDFLKGQ